MKTVRSYVKAGGSKCSVQVSYYKDTISPTYSRYTVYQTQCIVANISPKLEA